MILLLCLPKVLINILIIDDIVILLQGWLAWERFRCNTDCDNDPENCISGTFIPNLILIVIVTVIVGSSLNPVKVIFTERLFKSMADQLVLGGWREAGYDTIIMDDCWLAPQR